MARITPPPLLSIGVDIGGTKVAAGVVDEEGRILDRWQEPTPSHSPQAVEDAILRAVEQLRKRHRVEAVGIGAAGWVDNDQAVVRFSPHLAWRSEPLKARLTGRIDIPLIVDNDANAAAWAEYRYGAGRGSSVMVCITLGTGIGGGLVIGGRLFRGSYGMAGEWGHMISVPGGHWCECGNRGCWEQYASGNALVRDARALGADQFTDGLPGSWRSSVAIRTRSAGLMSPLRPFRANPPRSSCWPMSGPGSDRGSPTSPQPWILRWSSSVAE